jgi:hypothetical protein
MPTTYNLRASNNATFHWTRDLTPFAAVYNLAAATIRLQARTSPFAPDPPAYQWLSGASKDGEIIFNPTTNLCVFVAPEADMARMQGDFVYDCRLEFSGGGSIVIFGGRLGFLAGVTRLADDLSGASVSGLGDTVSVEGERAISPVPLPLSLSAVVAACQAAQAAAASSQASAASSEASAAASEASAAAWAESMTTAIAGAVASLDLGSASQQPASAFDAAGAAAAAQTSAEAFATTVAATAQSNAEAFANTAAGTALSAAEAFTTSAIAAALTPSAILALLTAGGASSPLALALAALIPQLPTAPSLGVATLWSDGGVPAVSEG